MLAANTSIGHYVYGPTNKTTLGHVGRRLLGSCKDGALGFLLKSKGKKLASAVR